MMDDLGALSAACGVDLVKLKQKYSGMAADRSQVVCEETVFSAAKSSMLTSQDIANRLDNYKVCKTCGGQGIVKTLYNHRVMESNCEECDGEGVITESEINNNNNNNDCNNSDEVDGDVIYDVIIVGAGLSGLACADYITQNTDKTCLILESRDRPGGRTFTEKVYSSIDGTLIGNVDIGGQWIGAKHDQMLQYVKRFQLNLDEQFYPSVPPSSDDIQLSSPLDQYLSLVGYRLKELDEAGKQQIIDFFTKVDQISASMDINNIKNVVNSAYYDSISISDFIRDHVHDREARVQLNVFFETIIACNTHNCSCLFMLFYIQSSGGVRSLGDGDEGAQKYKVRDGIQSVYNSLVKDMSLSGRCIISYNSSCGSIIVGNKLVTIHCCDGTRYKGRTIVLAMGLDTVLQRISFNIPLPREKLLVSKGMVGGIAIKVIIFYDYPFWLSNTTHPPLTAVETVEVADDVASSLGDQSINVENGTTKVFESNDVTSSGTAFTIGEIGPVKNLFDGGKLGDYYYLVGLITGGTCQQFIKDHQTVEARQAEILNQISIMYNHNSDPIAYVEKNWCEDSYSSGCFASSFAPNTFHRAAPYLSSNVHDRIFFAGSESSKDFNGYMEGAVLAGICAAKESMKHL